MKTCSAALLVPYRLACVSFGYDVLDVKGNKFFNDTYGRKCIRH